MYVSLTYMYRCDGRLVHVIYIGPPLRWGFCRWRMPPLRWGFCCRRTAWLGQLAEGERSPCATLRRELGRRRITGRHLDLTWAHSALPRAGTPRAGHGRRYRHHTPRASATPTVNTALPRAVYAEGCRRRSICRGHWASCTPRALGRRQSVGFL
jgi:hypothetical protein